MSLFREDPSECPICGAAHCACSAGESGPTRVTQLPMRDAMATTPPQPALGDGSDDRPFSTATYRGMKKKR